MDIPRMGLAKAKQDSTARGFPWKRKPASRSVSMVSPGAVPAVALRIPKGGERERENSN
jgi:hypothetical protein